MSLNNNNINIKESVNKILKKEEEFGLTKISTYLNFGKKVEKLKKSVVKNIKELKIAHPLFQIMLYLLILILLN